MEAGEDKVSPKILVCTIESWNSKIGANTFSTLLANYPAEHLANLYIREELPDSSCCSRYFQISEAKVIRSIVKRSTKTGREVTSCQQMSQADQADMEASHQLYNKNRKKRSFFKLFIREILWKLGKWKTPELDSFLDSFQPDIILFGMEGYIHFNRICRYAVKRTGAKAVGYFWDDTFTYKQMPGNFGYKALRFFKRRSLKKLAPCCDAFWAIAEKTKQEADRFFHIDCKVITKPIDFREGEQWETYEPGKPIQMLYTGNLLIGRFQVIQAISKALERINADGTKIELDVYSASYIPPEDLAELSQHVHIKGVVPQEEALQLQKEADILLFAEAITGEHSQIARLSFSTKLTDYFHSGKCILAVGAKDVAPMEYLAAENAALCASSEEEVYLRLKEIADQPQKIHQFAEAAYRCGQKNHSRQAVEAIMKTTFQEILGY